MGIYEKLYEEQNDWPLSQCFLSFFMSLYFPGPLLFLDHFVPNLYLFGVLPNILKFSSLQVLGPFNFGSLLAMQLCTNFSQFGGVCYSFIVYWMSKSAPNMAVWWLYCFLSQHVAEFSCCGMNWLVLANPRAHCEEWQTSNITQHALISSSVYRILQKASIAKTTQCYRGQSGFFYGNAKKWEQIR